MQKVMILCVLVAMALGFSPAAVSAVDNVALVVSGNVNKPADLQAVQISWADLEAMPQTSFLTSTIWTQGKHKFSGVALADLIKAIGAKGSKLKATALNNYSVEIPISDAVAGGPVLAYKIDGERLSVREKGPLWLVYPYDDNVAYKTETIYSRSIWQLERLEVVD